MSSQSASKQDQVRDGYKYNGEGEPVDLPIGQYATDPLTKSQRTRLRFLGWTNADVEAMPLADALAHVKAGSAKPGSKAFLKRQVNPLTGTKDVSGLIGRFSDEEIAARAEGRPAASGIQVTTDEFTNKCLKAGGEPFVMDEYTGRITKGADPLNAVLIEMQERFPDRRFRWMHPKEPPVLGPGWDPVFDAETGKRVLNGELALSWMPEAVYREGREKPNLDRSRLMTGAIEKNKDDQLRSTEEGGNVTEGKFELGKSEAFHA